MQKNGLIRKLRKISKFMTSQTGKVIITILILTTISRKKSKLSISLDQLSEIL